MEGITPIIASVLLLLIALSLVGFAFVFLGRTATSTMENIGNQTSNAEAQMGIVFDIENVDGSRISIRNRGAVPISGLAFYVNGENVEVLSGPLTLAPSTVGIYQLNNSRLFLLPDPSILHVASAGMGYEINTSFYDNSRFTLGYWKFDEASGSVAYDSSGNKNDGKLIHGPTHIAGKFGGALHFNGINQFVNISNIIGLNPGSTNITVSAWIRTTDPGRKHLLNKVDSCGVNGYALRLNPDSSHPGVPAFLVGQTTWTYASGAINDGKWHHVAGIYNGTKRSIYVDGNFVGSDFVMVLPQADSPLQIGGSDYCNMAGYFNGDIDEVRVLNMSAVMG